MRREEERMEIVVPASCSALAGVSYRLYSCSMLITVGAPRSTSQIATMGCVPSPRSWKFMVEDSGPDCCTMPSTPNAGITAPSVEKSGDS